jgi:hypothetical protein
VWAAEEYPTDVNSVIKSCSKTVLLFDGTQLAVTAVDKRTLNLAAFRRLLQTTAVGESLKYDKEKVDKITLALLHGKGSSSKSTSKSAVDLLSRSRFPAEQLDDLFY